MEHMFNQLKLQEKEVKTVFDENMKHLDEKVKMQNESANQKIQELRTLTPELALLQADCKTLQRKMEIA